jgi:metal-responsive CopG/Arc/MetJ family transcriptional regulator
MGKGVIMKTLKTAVSIPEEILQRAEETARRLGMNRSQMVSAALADFLAKHGEDRVTEKLNEVYRSEKPGLDPVLATMQFSALSCEDRITF